MIRSTIRFVEDHAFKSGTQRAHRGYGLRSEWDRFKDHNAIVTFGEPGDAFEITLAVWRLHPGRGRNPRDPSDRWEIEPLAPFPPHIRPEWDQARWIATKRQVKRAYEKYLAEQEKDRQRTQLRTQLAGLDARQAQLDAERARLEAALRVLDEPRVEAPANAPAPPQSQPSPQPPADVEWASISTDQRVH